VVRLTWDAVPSGGAELGYRVYRKASHDPAAALLATLPLSAASYNDSTPASGATYDFSLATYNATSESPRTALTVAVPGAVGLANRLGLGPVSADLSAGAITRAGVAAMREVASRLRIDARWLIFGHTHRRGPRAEEAEWLLQGGGRMLNTGSWIHAPSLLGPTAAVSDWWPGTVAVIEDSEPRLQQLLDDLSREDLRRSD